MIDRRRLLVGGLMLAAWPTIARAAPTPPTSRIGFDVIRDGSKLGAHVLSFDTAGNDLTVNVAVDLAYDLGPVTLFRYTHRATERWRGSEFVSVESTTDDDGDDYQVTATRQADGFVVEGNRMPRYVAPLNTLPATHWNRDQLKGPWINTQNGKLMNPQVTDRGINAIPVSNGGEMNARQFTITGDAQLDMWYDDAIGWSGLLFSIDDVPIRYVRQV